MLQRPPELPLERIGWRHEFYSHSSAEHLLHDPAEPRLYLDPWDNSRHHSPRQRAAWVLLQYERTYRTMRSLAALYALTGNERCARWVADCLLQTLELFRRPELRQGNHDEALYFSPLYDAQMLMHLAAAYEMTRDSGAVREADREALEREVFEQGIQYQLRAFEKMGVHNIACYVCAAIGQVGYLLGKRDWIELAHTGGGRGFAEQVLHGVPVDEAGRLDGFWWEGTMFYHFYALAPLISLLELARGHGADLAADPEVKRRFHALFEAPVQLCDQELRLPTVGDLGAPKVARLPLYRHLYEYAAAHVDPARYGPVLAALLAGGAPRAWVTALAFGPDELPPPGGRPTGTTVLPRVGLVAFRGRHEDADHYVLFKCGPHGGGHDHNDKLEFVLHARGQVLAPDLGTAGYALNEIHPYYRSTLAHNTIIVDDEMQAQVKQASLDFDPGPPPRARGTIKDAYEGVTLTREVTFAPPYLRVEDVCHSNDPHTYSWVFHAYGTMVARPSREEVEVSTKPLPREGVWKHLQNREMRGTQGLTIVEWRLAADLWLRLLISSDGPYDCLTGRTPGQPMPDTLGTVIIRAGGTGRRFHAAFEVHTGTPTLYELSAP